MLKQEDKMNMIKRLLEIEHIYLELLGKKMKFHDYFVIGKYDGKDVVIYKDDLIKGFWLPKILK